MTYTADMNHVHMLESGNWFSNFIADIEDRTVSFTYHDRRRAGQVARHYTIKFKADLSTVEDIVAVSAQAGRIEHFKSTVARETCANIIRRAKMVEVEQKLEEECEPKVEPAKVEICDKIINNMKSIAAMLAVVAFISTLGYFFFFDEVSTVEAVMNALIGAEIGCLVALIAVSFAQYHK